MIGPHGAGAEGVDADDEQNRVLLTLQMAQILHSVKFWASNTVCVFARARVFVHMCVVICALAVILHSKLRNHRGEQRLRCCLLTTADAAERQELRLHAIMARSRMFFDIEVHYSQTMWAFLLYGNFLSLDKFARTATGHHHRKRACVQEDEGAAQAKRC